MARSICARWRLAVPVLLLGLGLGAGCSDDAGSDGEAGETEGDGEGAGEYDSAIVRRLSVHELGNSLEDVLGFRPEALSRIPPDARDARFDRVRNLQTISLVHIDAFEAIAAEASTRLLADGGLTELSDACASAILPPAVPEESVRTAAVAMVGQPEWAHCTTGEVGIEGNCPTPTLADDAIYFLYEPQPFVSSQSEIGVAGTYALTLQVQSPETPAIALEIDSIVVDTQVVAGTDSPELLTFEVELEPGPHELRWAIDFTDSDGQSFMHILDQHVTGPLDPAAGALSGEREVCVHAAMEMLAERAFRRPLDAGERARIESLYATGVELEGFHAGLGMVVAWILRSPHFLYLIEVGQEGGSDAGGPIPLTSWELATRLSYTLCERPPDAMLRSLAEDESLLEPDVLEAQARRLLDGECGRTTVTRFFEQWLGVDALVEIARDPEVYPEFTPDMPLAMLAETRRYVTEMTYEREASVAELHGGRTTWVDGTVGGLYGLDVVGDEVVEVQLPEARAGLLTQPGVLTVTSKFEQTSPVHRGVFVLEEILCDDLPSPPEDIDIVPPELDPSLTTRERWEQHSSDPTCAACHRLMDPVGFALEEFDAIGRWRDSENGQPVDSTGGIPSLDIADGELQGGRAVAEAIAASEQASRCFARQWARFAHARLEAEEDPAISALGDLALESPIHQVMLELVLSDEFRYRYLPAED